MGFFDGVAFGKKSVEREEFLWYLHKKNKIVTFE